MSRITDARARLGAAVRHHGEDSQKTADAYSELVAANLEKAITENLDRLTSEDRRHLAGLLFAPR